MLQGPGSLRKRVDAFVLRSAISQRDDVEVESRGEVDQLRPDLLDRHFSGFLEKPRLVRESILGVELSPGEFLDLFLQQLFAAIGEHRKKI